MAHPPIKVEIGQKIHEWTVIEFDEKIQKKGRYFICQCKCGKLCSKPIGDLIRSGPKQCKSCACKERNFGALGNHTIDMVGKKIGKWTVLEKDISNKMPVRWKCQCECGSLHTVSGGDLRRARSLQCSRCARIKSSTFHGMAKKGKIAPEYNSWSQMKSRCMNANDKRYRDYGGRGIKICERWISSFESFLLDVGKKPSPIHSIDRIDNDGNYCPENVKWSTPKEQANNRKMK